MKARRTTAIDATPVCTVTYEGGAVTIAPWRVTATKGQSIQWTFVGCTGRITKKRFHGLPFGKLPDKPKKNVKSPPTRKTGRFSYNVVLEVAGRGRKKESLRIDPEMIILRPPK